MKRFSAITILLVLLGLLASQAALAGDYRDEPGYVDLEWIEIPDDAEEIQDIDLSAVLPGLAAQAKEKGDDALMQALGMIRMVRVKSFSLDSENADVARAVRKIQDQLDENGWKRLVYFKDDEESVTVSTRSEDGNMVGMMLVTYQPGDSVAFVNVVGDLDLATLLGLVSEFDSDNLEDILGDLEDVNGVRINRHSH